MQERREPGTAPTPAAQPRSEPISRQHHRSSRANRWRWGAALVVLALAGGALWWWWADKPVPVWLAGVVGPAASERAPAQAVPPAPLPVQPAAPPAAAPTVLPEATPPAAAAPAAVEHPLQPTADAQGNPPLAVDAGEALGAATHEWLGAPVALQYVITEALAQRITATIDNLPRKLAPVRLWPLHPVGGRMVVNRTDDGGMTIAPENAARYDGVVQWLLGMDAAQAASFYRRVYPVLQHAYEELGYPGQSFNTRLVATIDHLLQAPEPTEALALRQVQVQGSVPSPSPWLRYEFVDAELQAMSAGHKILVRMGVAHTQRIKGQLRALRAQIATP